MSRTLAIAFVVVVALKAAISPTKHTVYIEYTEAGQDIWRQEPIGFVAQQYLPFFSIALTPFAALPDRIGCPLWAVLSLAVYLTGLRAFHRAFLPTTSWPIFLLVGCSVGLSSLWNQQANTVIIGSLLWGTVAVRQERWWLAAVCLGLPSFKVYPLALGMVLSVLHPRLAWHLALVVIGLVLVPFVLMSPSDALTRYYWIAEYAAEGLHSLRFTLVGVRELLGHHGIEMSFGRYFAVQAVTGALILLVLLLNRQDAERRAFVMVSLWFVTFGPSVEAPTYLLAAPALGLLLVDTRQRESWIAFGFVLGTIILVGPFQTSLFGRDFQRWLALTRPGCVVLLMAFLWQLSVRLQNRERGV